MTWATSGPVGPGSARAATGGLIVTVGVPLAILGMACGLYWISDQLVVVGPVDRATFGWAVVIPVWCAAPVAASFLWRSVDGRQAGIAAGSFGLVASVVAGALFWRSVAFPECLNPVRSAADWIVPAILLGLTIGGGLAGSALLGRAIVRSGHPWRAGLITAGAEFGLIFVAIFVFTLVSLGAGYSSTSGICGLPN